MFSKSRKRLFAIYCAIFSDMANSITIYNFLQEFEEIVLDAKIERVRDVLMLNSQKPFLNLNHVDDLGQTLIHKVRDNNIPFSKKLFQLL